MISGMLVVSCDLCASSLWYPACLSSPVIYVHRASPLWYPACLSSPVIYVHIHYDIRHACRLLWFMCISIMISGMLVVSCDLCASSLWYPAYLSSPVIYVHRASPLWYPACLSSPVIYVHLHYDIRHACRLLWFMCIFIMIFGMLVVSCDLCASSLWYPACLSSPVIYVHLHYDIRHET